MEHRDSQQAFKDAIGNGILNEDEQSPLYAGNWMYMHSDGIQDAFKNIISREYLHTEYSQATI